MPGRFRAAQGTLRAMATDANLRGVYIPLITPFAADGSVATRRARASLPRVPRRRRGRDRRARHHRRVDRARRRREARGDRRACSKVCAERARAADRRRGHEQHRERRSSAVEGARGHAGARRHADRRAVLRAPVGGRHRRPLQGGGRGEPGAARPLQHPRPHRRQPRAPRACSSSRALRTSPASSRPPAGLDVDTLELLRLATPSTSPCSAARTRSCSRSCSWAAPARSAPAPTCAPSGSSR